MKILICGAYGQLGSDCVSVFSEDHEVAACHKDELDIADIAAALEAVRNIEPDWIVNCAAYTAVDACESNRETAWLMNAKGPANLATAADTVDCRLLHVSTDYVFDGSNSPPQAYVEDDPVNPQSAYGESKAAGEQAVLHNGAGNCVVRTAWLYGRHGNNFLKTMLGLALKNPCQTVRVVADQFGSPTWSATLAAQIKALVEFGGSGIYHATAEGYGSWHDLAVYFLKRMGLMHAITPCSTEEYPTPAARPKNSILENSRLKAAGIHIMPDWQDDVDAFVEKWRQELMEECLPGVGKP